MGRKLKTWFLLLLILALIYIQQAPAIYAGDSGKVTEQSESVGESENPEGQGNPEAPEIPEEPEFPEEPEIPEEPLVQYQVEIPKEDGENGWYVTRPEIKICHASGRGITKYKVVMGKEVTAEGSIEEKGREIVLKKDVFRDGRSMLSIWMEDEDGKVVEDYSLEQELKVDTKAPEVEMKAPAGFAVWYQKEVKIHTVGKDEESGIKKIACYVDGAYVGEKKKAEGDFVIRKSSVTGKSLAVMVSAKDQAGNQSSQIESLYIDQAEPKVKISGADAYMITSRPVTALYEIAEENVLSEFAADTQWENVSGKKMVLPVPEWEKTEAGRKVSQTLTEDGIYRIHVTAKDRAGYEAEDYRQIIIDKENPIIRYVDDLQGQYMKSFMWNYLKEELVQDFTTYTYGVKLDGNLYQMGKTVGTEGRHLLEVQAVDAAGNEASAKAEFVIDHTKPEILFSNIEEGKTYEEECVCKVELENAEDAIQRIQINGENQTIDTGSNAFQCTLKVHQDYEVKVTAKDKAGNVAKERIYFKVAPKKNIFEKMAEPVMRKLNGEKERKEVETEEGVKNQKDKWWEEPMICLGIISCTVAAGGWYVLKRRKSA